MARNSPIIPVILSGGAGTRLWPLSRNARPKQFLKFGSEYTLIQETVLRCSGEIFDARPIVVSGESQRFLIAEDMQAIDRKADIILEPMRRDSCAAIVAGCLQALKRSDDSLVLILAADHKIPDHGLFAKAVAVARVDAEAGYLTTFGIKPQSAATGYGYIKPGAELRVGGSAKLDSFKEKPDAVTAEKYVAEGYLWNSGNFLFAAKRFIEEIAIHAPAILAAVQKSFFAAKHETDFIWLDANGFSDSPQISVDYAVMEKTKHAAVYAVDYEWNDIGSWDAVHSLIEADASNNVLEGRGLVLQGQNNFVHSTFGVTALYGVDDLVVIATKDAVLVTKRGLTEKVKDVVAALKAKGFEEAE
jgi:mannose-1-phosphate guanylyltransferase / mannose-6-phosphate isomerase